MSRDTRIASDIAAETALALGRDTCESGVERLARAIATDVPPVLSEDEKMRLVVKAFQPLKDMADNVAAMKEAARIKLTVDEKIELGRRVLALSCTREDFYSYIEGLLNAPRGDEA